jgi:hypothetical protein
MCRARSGASLGDTFNHGGAEFAARFAQEACLSTTFPWCSDGLCGGEVRDKTRDFVCIRDHKSSLCLAYRGVLCVGAFTATKAIGQEQVVQASVKGQGPTSVLKRKADLLCLLAQL